MGATSAERGFLAVKEIWVTARRYAKERYALGVWSIWTILCAELVSRGSLLQTLTWSVRHVPLLIVNGALVCCLLLLVTALTGRAKVAFWVMFSVVLAIASISQVKQRQLGLPLLPWDIDLLQELPSVLHSGRIFSLSLLWGLVGILVLGGLSYLLVHRLVITHGRIQRNERLSLAAVSLLVTALIALQRPFSLMGLLHIKNLDWDQVQNVRTNGFVLSLALNTRSLFSGHGNSNGDVVAAMERIQSYHSADEPKGPGKLGRRSMSVDIKPNIVVILSETFWDPTTIKSISYSQDPMPFFRSLREHYSSGWMFTPQFGGGTANIEYEVLTGLSLRFLPQGSFPSTQIMKNGTDSLASILARQGYVSTSISPWANTMYFATRVNRYLGFQRFISGEFMKQEKNGYYIPDREVARIIMDVSKRTPGPDFVFANTAENHYEYEPTKFKENTIKVKGTKTEFSKGQLETFAQGTFNADKMLQTLVNYFGSVDEPTILVFFGDHLPVLGDNYLVYKETNYISGEDDPDFLNKMFRVPVVVWNNYLPQHKDTLDINTSFLGPYILDLAKRPGTPFMDYLRDLSRRIPLIPPKNYWQAYGISEETLKPYQTLQEDILFGERKTFSDVRDKIIDPTYVLGYGKLRIDQAAVNETESSNERLLTITGENFVPLSKAFADGKALPTAWSDDHTLTVKLPADAPKGRIELQVRVLDPRNDELLAESNKVTVTLPDH